MPFKIPFGDWAEILVDFLLDHAQWLFDGIGAGVGGATTGVLLALSSPPGLVLAAVLVLISLWRAGWRFALFAAVSFVLIAGFGMWDQTVVTLALALTATGIALVVGLPLGIAAAYSGRLERSLRPILDLMQTMPAFVYLIPAAMFFGLGRVPGVIATIIFAMPPAVRLTTLGIKLVPRELVEAGEAFGCTRSQLLLKVQLPTALPSIMAGVNQTIMLSLSMVVIASMIGAGGLGNEVLRGIQRLDVGLGFESGLSVVMLAIILDRITQSFGEGRKPGALASVLNRLAFWRRPAAAPAPAADAPQSESAAEGPLSAGAAGQR